MAITGLSLIYVQTYTGNNIASTSRQQNWFSLVVISGTSLETIWNNWGQMTRVFLMVLSFSLIQGITCRLLGKQTIDRTNANILSSGLWNHMSLKFGLKYNTLLLGQCHSKCNVLIFSIFFSVARRFSGNPQCYVTQQVTIYCKLLACRCETIDDFMNVRYHFLAICFIL